MEWNESLLTQVLIIWGWRLQGDYFSSHTNEGRFRQVKNKRRHKEDTGREENSSAREVWWSPVSVSWPELCSGGETGLQRCFAGAAHLPLSETCSFLLFPRWQVIKCLLVAPMTGGTQSGSAHRECCANHLTIPTAAFVRSLSLKPLV